MIKSAQRRIRRLLGGDGQNGPALPQGFTPITQLSEQDVFIVGYPKSGNTWFQNLVAGVVYGVIPEFAPPTLVHQELIPNVHDAAYYKRYATPTFFKSHHLPRPEYRRVVYLLRDGRDAMVSYFHYLQALQEKIGFLELVQKGWFPSKWHEHVEAWLANPYQAEMMTIRYEDLKAATVQELQRFCEFIHLQRDQAHLEMMARSADFGKMQKREKEKGMGAENPKWQKDKLFTRRGQVGSFKDEMPPDVLQAFMEQSTATLRKTGYLDAKQPC